MTTPKVTVVIDSATVDGVPFTYGYVTITQQLRIPSDEDQVLIEPSSVRLYFGETGMPQEDLYPNDLLGPLQGDGTPGSYYTIEYFNCPGDPGPWSFYLLSTDGETQYLRDLAEQPMALPGEISADKNYTLEFSVTNSLTVTHNLGKWPAVTILDSSGDEVDVAPHHVSLNQFTVDFPGAFGGTVTCN
jgi:hypothetical protein